MTVVATAGRPVRTEPMLRLDLLPNFGLFAGGQPVPLSSSAERLLAYLALQDRAVRRTEVAAALWTDTTDERSAGSLRSTLWRLRQPGHSVVAATQTHLALAPQVRVDLVESSQLARRLIRDEAAPPEPGPLPGALESDLLPGWYADDDWLVVARERWRQLRLHALEALAGTFATAGRFAEAVDAAYAAVRAEPLRESAHRRLIEVHLAEGNRSEAVRQYRTFAAMLRDELGVSPTPRLVSLVRELA